MQIGTVQTFDIHADGNGVFQNVQVSLPAGVAAGKVTVSATGATSQRSGSVTLAILIPAPILPADGSLIRDQSSGRVYFIWGAVRHWIDSPAVLQILGFSNSPANLPSSTVNLIHEGARLGLTLVNGIVFPLMPVDNNGGSLQMSEPSDTPGKAFTITGSHFAHYEKVQVAFGGST